MLKQNDEDLKILFPYYTHLRFWDESRANITRLCLEVRVFDRLVRTHQTFPTEEAMSNPVVYPLTKKRVYWLMNKELRNYELQCGILSKTLRWFVVKHLSDEFYHGRGKSSLGGVTCVDRNSQQEFEFLPSQIESWRLLDKRTGEYTEFPWE